MKSKALKYIVAALITLSVLSPIYKIRSYAVADNERNGYYLEDNIKISAECAILTEASSGRVLFASNAEAKRAMASTTKIMTALVVIENCELDDIVAIPKEAVGIEGSSIYLAAGEKLTVKELLYGLMLRSGNDAATALAMHCSGSVASFVALMNSYAQNIGALNTSFANPSGLPAKDHYTTAYDLALISAKAMKHDVFREIVSTQKVTITWDGHNTDRLLINKNKMLYQYDGADGIKTGYTIAAGRCLVSSATRNGMTLIAVVLNSSPMYADCSAMLDFGFENYSMTELVSADTVMGSVTIKHGFEKSITYKASNTVSVPLAKTDSFFITARIEAESMEAPVYANEVIGCAEIYINGNKTASVPLILTASVKRNSFFSRFSELMKLHSAG